MHIAMLKIIEYGSKYTKSAKEEVERRTRKHKYVIKRPSVPSITTLLAVQHFVDYPVLEIGTSTLQIPQ